MKKRAFITGISGQDGSYLAEYLLSLNYEVFGLLRRHSLVESQDYRVQHLTDKIKTFYGDMTDSVSLKTMIRDIKPDEIYNLAGQSHVQVSFSTPIFTINTNSLGVLNILEAMREYVPSARLYQASSSEMFGDQCDHDGYQRETTPMSPVSPYGCSKLMAYNLMRNYRRSYGLFAANGILFNHSSPRRGMNFVEQKIVYGAARIVMELDDTLELGNLESFRDIGHSKDYVRAMHAILNHEKPDDFVIATGYTRSIRQICEFVFGEMGLDYQKHVKINPAFLRPQELPYLKGDSTKARSTLGWEPQYTPEELLKEMIMHAIINIEAEIVAKNQTQVLVQL
jgi:GDPmannose 4,6-dehydratase